MSNPESTTTATRPDPRDVDEYTLILTVQIPRNANIRQGLMEQAERISMRPPESPQDAFGLILTNSEFPADEFCRYGGGWWFDDPPLTYETLDDATVYRLPNGKYGVVVFSGGSLTGFSPVPYDKERKIVRVAHVEGPEFLVSNFSEATYDWVPIREMRRFVPPEVEPEPEPDYDPNVETGHRWIPQPLSSQIQRHLFDWHDTSACAGVPELEATHDNYHDHARVHGWHQALNAHTHDESE